MELARSSTKCRILLVLKGQAWTRVPAEALRKEGVRKDAVVRTNRSMRMRVHVCLQSMDLWSVEQEGVRVGVVAG